MDFEQIYQNIYPWLASSGLKIVAIVVIAVLFNLFGKMVIEKIVRKTVISDHFLTPEAEKKREDTLTKVFYGTLRVLVWLVVAMMILSEVGVNIGPLLAAAGIIGLAVGFGGQYIIRDILTGFFIILENQYRVGDMVDLDGTSGVVEDITLRSTVLRDLDGVVHHVPNGEIKKTANKSKDFSRVNLDIGVSYDADLKKVIDVVNRVGDELANDPEFKEKILEPPKFLRVHDLADSSVVIKILGKTKPLCEPDITGELRKRIKITFDQEGIEIPFPQMVIHKNKD